MQLYVPPLVYQRLRTAKKALGLSFGAVISQALERMAADGFPRPNPETLLSDSRPWVVTGPSGAGKTRATKGIIQAWKKNVLVFDVSNEYPELRKVKDSRDIDFSKRARVRIVAEAQAEFSKVTGAFLFRDLTTRGRTQGLKDWLLVIEEAHRFADDPGLKDLVLEGRKFAGKVLVLTADAEPWREIAPVARA